MGGLFSLFITEEENIDGIKKEIEVNGDFGSLITDSSTCSQMLCSDFAGYEIYLLNNLFNGDEITSLINKAEQYGFGYTSYVKSYRGNLRLIAYDASLSLAVWKRIEKIVPHTVTESGQIYEVIGLNKCWRIAKYFSGDRFMPHVDACYAGYDDVANCSVKSMFTVNIYMNGGFEGGNTVFTLNDKNISIVPEAGLCVVFRQPPTARYSHEGLQLKSGIKYLFRSDIMYKSLGAVK